jgi:tetratricopeptide (TPR) repeat protein
MNKAILFFVSIGVFSLVLGCVSLNDYSSLPEKSSYMGKFVGSWAPFNENNPTHILVFNEDGTGEEWSINNFVVEKIFKFTYRATGSNLGLNYNDSGISIRPYNFPEEYFGPMLSLPRFTSGSTLMSEKLYVKINEEMKSRFKVNTGTKTQTTDQLRVSELIAQADSYFDDEDFDRAFSLYMDVNNREDITINQKAWAQYNIALIYDEIRGDTAMSFEWYTKAAELGQMTAQLNLGNHYFRIEEYNKAFELYLKAAIQGEPQAQWNVSVCYYNGLGVEKDNQNYAEWVVKAYENGSKDAEIFLREKGVIK